jgi:NAD(P)-dependent dehydrogenase (short-subunit alcohol dehydrogenase family)
MTRSLALEYIKTGVRINVVAPGFTDTPLNNNATDDLDQDAHWDLLMRATVPRGMAHPGEVARVIVWAASENASAVHGAVIHADQGLTAG